jgi:hypothetical protein
MTVTFTPIRLGDDQERELVGRLLEHVGSGGRPLLRWLASRNICEDWLAANRGATFADFLESLRQACQESQPPSNFG